LDLPLLHEITNNIQEYKRNNIYVEDVFIFIKGIDIVLSSSGFREAPFFFEQYYKNNISYSGISYDQWYDLVNKDYDMDCLTFTRVFQGNEIQYILYLQSLPFSSSTCKTTVVVTLDRKKLD